jgi:inorganic triphosphatase YgiF
LEPTPQEVELKLAVAQSDLPRLRRSALFRERGVGRSRTQRLHAVYFDTPDLDLRAAGLALRVRREGRRYIQALKSADAGRAGLFARAEWECPVSSPAPDLDAIPEPARGEVLRAIEGRPLEPVVETDVRRTRRVLRWLENEVRADLDVGVVRTARGEAPVCELELELARGDPGALYDLALELHASVAVRPGGESKADLGFAMLEGRGPSPQRARAPRLAPEATLDEALAAIFGSGLDQVGANVEAACAGVDPEGVHQLRVGVRRLRSAFALLQEFLPEEPACSLRSELRWLGGELGPARDLDVFLAESLEPLAARFPDDPSLKRLREAAQELRDRAYDRVRVAVRSGRFGELMLRLGGYVAGRGWRAQPLTARSARLFAPARDTAAALLERRQRRIRRLARTATSAPERHALRIRVKKLRYACEFFEGLYRGRKPRRTIRRLARLQDVLGHLNDRAIAEHMLDEVLAYLGPEAGPECHRAAGFVAGWTARAGERSERALAKQIRRLLAVEPFWSHGG